MAKWQDDLQFYFMHFMPYTHLPPDHKKYDSLWVDFSNKHFDADKAHALYGRYFEEMALADKLGFDAVVVNEHHNTVYSMMPVCTVAAAALIPQTTQAKICVFGVPANLEMPNRLAEAYAMLDVMSGGRLEIAFPLGTGMEYWANSMNPAVARARFREAYDVIIQCWTQDGPTSFDGEFFSYRYLNPWPKPMQKPYPKIAVVGSGTPETIQFATEKGVAYSAAFTPQDALIKIFNQMRQDMPKYGHEFTPDKALANIFVYVAESKEQAERELKEHLRFLVEDGTRTTMRYQAPPGYIPAEVFRKRMSMPNTHGGFDWDGIQKLFRLAYGTPQQVAEQIYGWFGELQSSRVICNIPIGDMPHWKVVKSMTLFAEEVIPLLRPQRARQALAAE
jgi:alkanesulfonate monooxygenase SsuD/methylene tetrahydromethanopterin reductase-like flavin-dependent oxidoreductase (luciferase family)